MSPDPDPDPDPTCPVCDLTTESRTVVYRHLLTSHRKSSIAETLLEEASTEDPAAVRLPQ